MLPILMDKIMQQYEKKYITQMLHEESLNDCSLDNLLEVLKDWKDKYPEQKLFIDYNTSGYDGGYYSFNISFQRLETDKEFNSRVQFLEEQNRIKEQKEMERLLKCKTLNEANKAKLIKYIEKYK